MAASAGSASPSPSPSVSPSFAKRILGTQIPIMVQMQQLWRETSDCLSLAQGVVYWQPPAQALEKVKDYVSEPSVSNYGADDGIPELRSALVEKIAYPSGVEGLGAQLLKVQDNIPICASIISQKLALLSLEVGCQWVHDRVEKLAGNIDIIMDALSPLGEGNVKGGEGAIYFWAKLPNNAMDDFAVVHWLAKKHKIAVIPGTASGGPGHIRVSFGGLSKDNCELAATRLRKGLEELLKYGTVP